MSTAVRSGAAGEVPHEATFPAMLEWLAAEHGAVTCLVDGDRATSFAELDDRSRRLAAGLATLGVRRGDVVAAWLPNGTAWVELQFAAARLGAVVLSVNTKLRSHDVGQLLRQGRADVLALWPSFHGIDFLDVLGHLAEDPPGWLRHVLLVGDPVDPDRVPPGIRSLARPYAELFGSGRHEQSAAAPDLLVNTFTSSGTTSAPKLVGHVHRALVGHAHAVADAFGYRAPDAVVLGMLPFAGVFGFNTLIAALAAGRPLVVQALFDGQEATGLIERHRVTHTTGADEMLRRILAAGDPPERIGSLREAAFASFGGDPHALVTAAEARGMTFFQTYGSSEVQALMCYPPPGADVERRSLGGGVPVHPGISVRIRDTTTGELVAEGGGEGEIEIAGPNVSGGYLHQPDATAASRTDDGYFRTGDLGRLRPGRDMVYLARLGDALRLGGYLVAPVEIESYLETLPGVGTAQVVGVRRPEGDVAVGFVVGDRSHALAEEELIASCRAELARFKVPRRILVVDGFPTTRSANGDKIQRVRLRETAAAVLDQEVSR
ncbi:AMP-binding protein [Geodermatophilus sp. DSM 44513]|uniref:AMP-binding protein n=1 Tax=Geodermatophilus sp. DSM 44513 TaxID=1528104 RepID=UPI001412E39B|nr:AMP-binding protein [Geodermatophilus sp. DSM 44513]WNV76632.1 AMP-binding protein [Geodermatophilus sp. DSM 44513]